MPTEDARILNVCISGEFSETKFEEFRHALGVVNPMYALGGVLSLIFLSAAAEFLS